MCLSPRRRPVAPALTSGSPWPSRPGAFCFLPTLDNSKMPQRKRAEQRLKGGTGGQTAAAVRARVSQRRRTVSSAALSTVNADAVIQADPASGSAAPSMTTAT